MAALVD